MEFSYHHLCPTEHVPVVCPEDILEQMHTRLGQGWRLLCLCGIKAEVFGESPHGEGTACLLCLMVHDASARCFVQRTAPLAQYAAFTKTCPQAHMFEREIYEQYGVLPEGHPWLKPVRFVTPASGAPRPLPGDAKYFRVEGVPVHEVAVGPIHAGVIEPGHFRFQCYGESVMYLEIGLGFQHRAIEQILPARPVRHWLPIIECVAGDTSIANATAYTRLMEKLADTPASPRGEILRALSLELERLACHTGDLGAMGGDVGYLPTSQWCGRIRGDFLNITALLCGNRFGRGMVCPGGTAFDMDADRCATLLQRLDAAYRDVCGAVDLMLHAPSVRDRFAETGVVSASTAQDLGLVGMAARSCGLVQDARYFYGDGALMPEAYTPRTQSDGDVLARALVRRAEIDDSYHIIRHLTHALAAEPTPASTAVGTVRGGMLALSCVEGWRGTVSHIGITDPAGALCMYKMIDPSFYNWTGLAMALRNGEISDFPLCNKSFNLSYCGHDL